MVDRSNELQGIGFNGTKVFKILRVKNPLTLLIYFLLTSFVNRLSGGVSLSLTVVPVKGGYYTTLTCYRTIHIYRVFVSGIVTLLR